MSKRPASNYRHRRATHWLSQRRAVQARYFGGYETGAGTPSRRYRRHGQAYAEWSQATPAKRTELTESARDADRGNAFVMRLLNAGVEHVVGAGPTITPTTADPGWNAAAAAIYAERCLRENFSAERMLDETLAAQLIYRTLLRDGAVLAYHPYGRVQWFESGQIVSPRDYTGASKLRDGIQFSSKTGALEGFWVGPYNKYGTVSSGDAYFLKAWWQDAAGLGTLPRCSYLYRTHFLSGYHGIAALGTIADDLERLEEYKEAVTERALMEATVFAVQYTNNAERARKGISVGRQDDDASSEGKDTYDRVAYGEPGAVYQMARDDRMEQLGLHASNANIETFFKTLWRQGALPISMPLEVALFLWDQNFSASRGVLEIFKRWCRQEKARMVAGWWRPNYQWAIYDAIIGGDLPARADWRNVDIIPDGWAYLNPLEDVQTNRLRRAIGEATQGDLLAEQGRGTSAQLFRRLAAEYQQAQAVAKETGVPIEFLYRPMNGFTTTNNPQGGTV